MPFQRVEAFAANVGAELDGVLAVRPAHVVGPLEAVLDIEIGIAAAPTGELRGAGELSGVVERDAGEAEHGRGEQRQVVLLRESDAILAAAENAAVVAHVAEAELVHQGRREDVDVGKHGLRGVILLKMCRRR